jgi:hypothetical protein
LNATTRTVFAIQSTADNYRGAGLFYRKHTGGRRGRNRDWVLLDEATTFPNYALALRQQTALDVSSGHKCTRVVELEMNLRLREPA